MATMAAAVSFLITAAAAPEEIPDATAGEKTGMIPAGTEDLPRSRHPEALADVRKKIHKSRIRV